MTIATEETRLLSMASLGGLDDSKQKQRESCINKSNRYNYEPYYHPKNIVRCLCTNHNFERNSIVLKVITYSAVAISILLGLLLAISAIENLRTENILLNRFSSSWWDSSKEYADSWFHQHHTHNDGNWGHFQKWKKEPWIVDGNTSEHFRSSVYEYDSDGTPNGTKHTYKDRETWTVKNDNGTITHYERWTDDNGVVHRSSSTSG
jgi:hypothetical protein